MTDRELMQHALDALEGAIDAHENEINDHITKYGEWYRPQRIEFMRKELANTEQTIEALRARLAQPEPKNKALTHEELKAHNQKILDEFYKENAALYEPKPLDEKELARRTMALYPTMPVRATEEPICAPSQREWQGLTDEEAEDILKGSKNAYAAILAIEAKLKEKNT